MRIAMRMLTQLMTMAVMTNALPILRVVMIKCVISIAIMHMFNRITLAF
jgi:hypothetical protein